MDQHFNLTTALGVNCRSVDQPIAGLLTDLKQRGLLKDTLVIWGGEFGRILGQTKLDSNSCQLSEARPIKIRYSDAIGEILLTNPVLRQKDRRHYVTFLHLHLCATGSDRRAFNSQCHPWDFRKVSSASC